MEASHWWEVWGSKGQVVLEEKDGDGVGLWKAIRRGWGYFKSATFFQEGNGERTSFWKDTWCGDGDATLSTSLPSLSVLLNKKNAWVVDIWGESQEGGHWNPCFSRQFNDWELKSVNAFLAKLQKYSMKRGMEDRLVWKELKGGCFSVKAFYSCLKPKREATFLVKVVWNLWGLMKVGFLLRKQPRGEFGLQIS